MPVRSCGALLGYQLERGLHENHPGIELDIFIWRLRERFPFVSKRLTDVPDGTAAEVIEARNVVDGYDLVEHIRGKTYPIRHRRPAGRRDPPRRPRSRPSSCACRTRSMRISDLMMAESVHQAVQNNADRARGVLQSIVEGDLPPVPDVVATPRSGRVLSQRVVIHLPDVAVHWPTTTARSRANAALNTWLASQLPDPDDIAIGFRLTGEPQRFLTLAAAGIDAIDAVLMSADTIGDGAGELERWLTDRWRAAEAIGTDVPTRYREPCGYPRRRHRAGRRPGAGAARQATARGAGAAARCAAPADHHDAAGQRTRLPPALAGHLADAGQPQGLAGRRRQRSRRDASRRHHGAGRNGDACARRSTALVNDVATKAAYEALLADAASFEPGRLGGAAAGDAQCAAGAVAARPARGGAGERLGRRCRGGAASL